MDQKLPRGYFADYEVKKNHNRKEQEEREWRTKRDKELEKKHRLKRNDRGGELICMRCDEPVQPTEDSMRSVKCKKCERIWFEEDD